MFSGIVNWFRGSWLVLAMVLGPVAMGPVAMGGQGVGPSVLEVTQNAERTQIVIIGTGFGTSAPYVSLSGTNLSVVSYSDRQITAKLPVGLTAGSYPLRVVNSRTGAAARFQTVVGMMEGQVSSGIPEPDGGSGEAAVAEAGTTGRVETKAGETKAGETKADETRSGEAKPVVATAVAAGSGTSAAAAVSRASMAPSLRAAADPGSVKGDGDRTRAARVRQPASKPVARSVPGVQQDAKQGGMADARTSTPVNRTGKGRSSETKLQARLEGALGPEIGDERSGRRVRSSGRKVRAGSGSSGPGMEAGETTRLTGALGPVEVQSSATAGVNLPGTPGIAGLLGALNPVEPTRSEKTSGGAGSGIGPGNAGVEAPGGGVGVRSKGPFDGTVSYGASDVVSYNGFYYVALAPVSGGGSTPDQGGGWHILARETDVDAGTLKTAAPSELELAGSLSLSQATGPLVGNGMDETDALIGALGP